MALIERKLLRTDVRRYLVERLLSGEIEPGSQIVERELADKLGVSRTPLREALLQLEFEGFLEVHPGKGFLVRDLVETEVIEIFAVGKLLESFALRQGGIPEPETLGQLERVNEERAGLIGDPTARQYMVELDDRWHRLLVAECKNQLLLELLHLVRNRMYRYLLAFTSQRTDLLHAIEEHRRIMQELKNDNLEGAITALEEHWDVSERSMRRLVPSTLG